MKKSQIAVLGALIFIAVVMLVLMGLGRIAVGKAIGFNAQKNNIDWSTSGADTSEILNLKGFDSVVVEGAWMVRVKQSPDFNIEIRYPSELEEQVRVRVRGSQLVLGTQDWYGHSDGELIAEISMPALSELRIEGAADADFSGFDEKNLDIILDGAAQIYGYDSKVSNLYVRLQGIGQIDLDGVDAVNAHVELEGAGEIRLAMSGGELTGSLEGLGQIIYSGSVSEEDVKVDGLGQVKRR